METPQIEKIQSNSSEIIKLSFLPKYKNYILIFALVTTIGIAGYFVYKKLKKDKIDCQVSDWIYNNNCICDDGSFSGYKYKYRNIIKNAENNGTSCPNPEELKQKVISCNCPTPSPSGGHTMGPTMMPTIGPTMKPTMGPTMMPTIGPTIGPTMRPTMGPTPAETVGPNWTPSGNSDLPPSLSSLNKNIFIRSRQNNGFYTIRISTDFGIIRRMNMTAPNNDDNFSENTNKIVRVMDPNNFIINYNKPFRSVNFQYKYDPETDLLLEIKTGLKFLSF